MTAVVTETLITQVSTVLYGISTVAFLAATWVAVQNYKKTHGISNYWLIFAIAVGIGTVFTGISALEQLGIATVLLDQLDRWIALIFIIVLIMTSIETLTTSINVTVE